MWFSEESNWDVSTGTHSCLDIPFHDLETIMAVSWFLTSRYGLRGSKWNFDLRTEISGSQLIVDIVFLNPADATLFKLSYDRDQILKEYLTKKKFFDQNFLPK